jgi:probable rRNA maturation factor
MIQFFVEKTKFALSGKRLLKKWIVQIMSERGFECGEINIIFVPDSYILELNKKSLGHNFYTDIITFDYSVDQIVNGDLYISADTVCANADLYKQTFEKEICRVVIHGILHMIGEDDLTPVQQKKMRAAENSALKKLSVGSIKCKLTANNKKGKD